MNSLIIRNKVDSKNQNKKEVAKNVFFLIRFFCPEIKFYNFFVSCFMCEFEIQVLCDFELFSSSFLLPQELDLPSPGGIHYGFAWRCFPILGRELKFFGVDGGFPHSPGSTGSGHFLYTIVSRLGSCCKFSPLVSLQDNHMGVRSTRVRTIVCYSCSYVGTVVPIQTCMGPRPDSSQLVNIIRHSVDANLWPTSHMYPNVLVPQEQGFSTEILVPMSNSIKSLPMKSFS